MRFIAPAGTKIKFKDLFFWLVNIVKKENAVERFKKAVRNKFKIKHCFFFGTGRTGMAFLLKSLYELDTKKRNEVIIPSYTCYSVPAAIEYAGLKIRILDIDLKTLDYNYSQLQKTDFKNVLAIVSSNLYGIPNDLEKLEEIAIQNKIYFIDDAAQSMGAKFNGRYAGTYGDAGLFSLDKGKNITTLDGGIIITNSEQIAKKLEKYSEYLKSTGIISAIIYMFKVVAYSIFLRPSLYWIPNSLSFLKLGETNYDPQMPLFKYDKIRASLGIVSLKKLDEVNAERKKNGLLLKEKLQALHGLDIPETNKNCKEVFLRFPVLADKNLKPKIIETLNNKGIGATGSYPKSVININEIKHLLNQIDSAAEAGLLLAEKIITLPTHAYLDEADIENILSIFQTFYHN